MLMYAYTLYDSKALVYSPPFYGSAHGMAVRMTMDLANDTSNMVGRHPADFTLFCIGQFNDATGSLLPFDVREHISDVLPLIRNRQADFFGQHDPVTQSPTNGNAS